MPRTIKRYESRKLYDARESRYVSLQELAEWIRDGEEIAVVDNSTSEDVTSQTLAQVILEEGRNGRGRVSSEVLHDLVRSSGEKLSSGVHSAKKGINRFVQASFDRLGPVKEAREEMGQLRSRLDELESTLAKLEADGDIDIDAADGDDGSQEPISVEPAVAEKDHETAPREEGDPK